MTLQNTPADTEGPVYYVASCGQGFSDVLTAVHGYDGFRDLTLDQLIALNPQLLSRPPQSCEPLRVDAPLPVISTGDGGVVDDNDPDPEWWKNPTPGSHPPEHPHVLNPQVDCQCL